MKISQGMVILAVMIILFFINIKQDIAIKELQMAKSKDSAAEVKRKEIHELIKNKNQEQLILIKEYISKLRKKR